MPVLKVLKQSIINVTNNYTIELAGYIAFTVLLSIFPFIIFLISMASLLGNVSTIESFIHSSLTFIPADVAKALMPIINEVLRSPHQGAATIAVLGTIWISSSGIEALRSGLNESYKLKETRSFFFRRLQSIMIVIGAAIVLCAATFLLIVGDLIRGFLANYLQETIYYFFHLQFSRYTVAAILFACVISILYYLIPNNHQRWRDVLPGAFLTTILWLLLASLFSIYCQKFANYHMIYGSLGGIALTMLFLHISAIFVLLGAEFNSVLKKVHPERDGHLKAKTKPKQSTKGLLKKR